MANAWVGHLLKREILRRQLTGVLDVPSDEGAMNLDRVLDTLDADALAPGSVSAQLAGETGATAVAAQRLQDRLAATRAGRTVLPFLRLCGELELDALESVLLLIVVSASTEPRVRRMVAALQSDSDSARISAGVVLSLLVNDAHGGNLPWNLLAPDGRLRAFQLLNVTGGPASLSLTSRFLSVPDPVAAYVTRGQLFLDESITAYARVRAAELRWDDMLWPSEAKRRLRRRLERCAVRAGEPVGVVLRGSVGAGRKTAALATARELGKQLLVVDADRLPADEEGTLAALRTAIRDARLFGALLYLENADSLRRETALGTARLRGLRGLTSLYGGLFFMATERLDRIDAEEFLELTSLEVPEMGPAERRALWKRVLPERMDPGGKHAAYLTARFPMNPGNIIDGKRELEALAHVSGGLLDRDEMVRAVLDRSRHNLRAIATEVKIDLGLDDIVLSPEVRSRVSRLIDLIERNAALREEWGLGKRALTHRGVAALFAGPPGTGKTAMAAIVGHHLGFDVFRIDVAQVISKWVGETEKNLSRLFAEAAHTRAVLVFDEADALFSKRIEVRAAVDRYSNSQVNYLLQKMEAFEGVVLLTTNMDRGIDEAFLRRLSFRIWFPEPDAAQREDIWRKHIPSEVGLGPDLDLRVVAEKFPLTGGAIRNAVVRACLIASSRGLEERVLLMSDVTQAILEEHPGLAQRRPAPAAVATSTIDY